MAEHESIPIRTLRNDVSQVIRRVEAGESFDVTRHGRPVARIMPVRPEKRPGTLADLLALRDEVPADPGWWAEIRRMRDEDPGRDPYERWKQS
jgi:prevent-host-death family protein